MKRSSGIVMRHAFLAASCVLASFVPTAEAEPLASGRYEGSAEIAGGAVRANSRPRLTHFALTVQRVEGGNVAGTWSQSPGPCPGEQPVEGRLDEGRLILKPAASGSGACKLPPIRLTLRDGALEGTSGSYEIRLKR